MLWFAPLFFVIGLAYRAYINRGATTATPDEKMYSVYAASWRPGESYRKAIEAFLSKPALEIPPTRFAFFAFSTLVTWGKKTWIECCNSVTWVATVSGALAAPIAVFVTQDWRPSLLVASSPLSLSLSRRALQDSFAALPVLVALWAVQMQNMWLLGVSVAIMLATREAMLLYLPALLIASGLKSGWMTGSIAVISGVAVAVALFYAVGGRKLVPVLRKLRQATDYNTRFQSGMPHRLLVDLVLVSPVTTIAGAIACTWAPLWMVVFVVVTIVTHAVVASKNIRFLLAVEIAIRMLCTWLPDPWIWVVLGLGSVADLRLYLAIGGCKDPVTYNLVVRTAMYTEKSG